MGEKLICIVVKGNRRTWGFRFKGDPKHLPEWRADGLDVYIPENSIPMWVVRAGLIHPWCFLQDLFNFKNPWRS